MAELVKDFYSVNQQFETTQMQQIYNLEQKMRELVDEKLEKQIG